MEKGNIILLEQNVLSGTMMHNKVWEYRGLLEGDIKRLSYEAGISTLLSKVFLSRGITDSEYIKQFLKPTLENLHDPFLLKDMDKAVSRIIKAIKNKEKVLVYGDYDVDGVTSTTILYDFLLSQDVDVKYFIPNRREEGYGLSIGAIDKILCLKPDLIITVDCGITAIEEVGYINSKKIEVIITDHHECTEQLPDAFAAINPCRHDCTYPFKNLAGVGVVYKLINAICIEAKLGDIYRKYLQFVCIGTVADVVPLIGENRSIVSFGLLDIERTSNIGLRTLKENCSLKDKAITSWSIGFIIGPRLNAAGRMGCASRAVRLFTTKDETEVFEIVKNLDEENKLRQSTEMEILNQAIAVITAEIDLEKDKVIVVSGEGWHHGVVGIVASRISEKYHRPSFLISIEEGIGKGSARSIEGFDLFKALQKCESLLERYGGHELAAGLSLKAENIPGFRKVINEYADTVLNENDLIPRIKIDIVIDKEEINTTNIKELDLLVPFGEGNRVPIFSCNNLKINMIKPVGDNKHLKLRFESEGCYFDAIGFNMGEKSNNYTVGDIIDAAFSLEINSWNSLDKAQMNLKDIKPNNKTVIVNKFFYNLDKNIDFLDINKDNKRGTSILDITMLKLNELQLNIQHLVPDRQDLVAVFQYIKSKNKTQILNENLFILSQKISECYKINMNFFKLKRSLEIFEELGFLKKESIGEFDIKIVFLNTSKEKTSLENSSIYKKLQIIKTQAEDA